MSTNEQFHQFVDARWAAPTPASVRFLDARGQLVGAATPLPSWPKDKTLRP